MIIYLAPLVCIVGALTYCFSGHPKLIELGRIAFFAGLLVTLLAYGGGHALRF